MQPPTSTGKFPSRQNIHQNFQDTCEGETLRIMWLQLREGILDNAPLKPTWYLSELSSMHLCICAYLLFWTLYQILLCINNLLDSMKNKKRLLSTSWLYWHTLIIVEISYFGKSVVVPRIVLCIWQTKYYVHDFFSFFHSNFSIAVKKYVMHWKQKFLDVTFVR